MRNFAISASLESLQEIQDTNSLNAPLYQYRLQTDTLQVWLPEFRHNFYFGISTMLFLVCKLGCKREPEAVSIKVRLGNGWVNHSFREEGGRHLGGGAKILRAQRGGIKN